MPRTSYSEGNFDTFTWFLFLGIILVAFILLTIAGMGRFQSTSERAADSTARNASETVDIGG